MFERKPCSGTIHYNSAGGKYMPQKGVKKVQAGFKMQVGAKLGSCGGGEKIGGLVSMASGHLEP